MTNRTSSSSRGTPQTVHVFERAGLGLAPFRCVGYERRVFRACPGAPAQPGAACNYCGTGIMDVYLVESADKRQFIVGCDCVAKTGDSGLRKQVDEQKRAADYQKRHARGRAKAEAIRAMLDDSAFQTTLTALPHPMEWAAKQGRTALDYAKWMYTNAGDTGRARLLKYLSGFKAVSHD